MVLFWSPFWTENVIISNPFFPLVAGVHKSLIDTSTSLYRLCHTDTTNRLVSCLSHLHHQQTGISCVSLTPTTGLSHLHHQQIGIFCHTDTNNTLVSRVTHWHHQQAGISSVSLTPPAGWYFVSLPPTTRWYLVCLTDTTSRLIFCLRSWRRRRRV